MGTDTNGKMVPALQLSELDVLNSAVSHLENNGFKAETALFKELKSSARKSWMDAENGDYILFIEEKAFQKAMESLEAIFGIAE
jgi:hypothetical protein